MLRAHLVFRSLLVLSLVGCAVNNGPVNPRGMDPADPMTPVDPADPTDPADTAECDGPEDCAQGLVCAAVAGVPRCVSPPTVGQPGDGTSCGDCPAPGECRAGVCLQPSATGEFCEFDTECEEDELCIAGRCTPDPRYSQPCTETSECAGTMTCAPAGICVCAVNTDCPSGLLCEGGACVPPDVPGHGRRVLRHAAGRHGRGRGQGRAPGHRRHHALGR
ncbi:MAG: hypothetical protein AAF548_07035 [Actinomycetota bacterium]